MTQAKISDEIYIATWQQFLSKFKTIIEISDEKSRNKKLNELKELANVATLTVRQREGITARCNNFLNGTYGNTKTVANLSVGKQ